MGELLGQGDQLFGRLVQRLHVPLDVRHGRHEAIDFAVVRGASAQGVLRVGGELGRDCGFGYRAGPGLGPLESAYDRFPLRLRERFRMPVSAHGPHRVSGERIARLVRD